MAAIALGAGVVMVLVFALVFSIAFGTRQVAAHANALHNADEALRAEAVEAFEAVVDVDSLYRDVLYQYALLRHDERVHREALDKADDDVALAAAWQAIPKKLRAKVSLLESYYQGLMRLGLHDRAEKELAGAIKSNWQAPLVRLYCLAEATDASKQLKRAEGWLAAHPGVRIRLLGITAGKLTAAAQLALFDSGGERLDRVADGGPLPEAEGFVEAMAEYAGDRLAALAWLRHPAHSCHLRRLLGQNSAVDYRHALAQNAALWRARRRRS